MRSGVTDYSAGTQFAYHDNPGYYEERAFGLLSSAEDETPGAMAAFDRLDALRTLDGARTVVARARGFDDWPAFVCHVRNLPHSGEPFYDAYRAIENHDPDRLRAVLGRSPEVVGPEETNGNDLLGIATATNDERTVELMLALGADPSHANAAGGRPCTRSATATPTISSTRCSTPARAPIRSAAATAARRSSPGCSGDTGRSPIGWSRDAGYSPGTFAPLRVPATWSSSQS